VDVATEDVEEVATEDVEEVATEDVEDSVLTEGIKGILP